MTTESWPDGDTGNDCVTAPCEFNWSIRALSAMACHVSTMVVLTCTLLALLVNEIICGTLGVAVAGGVLVAVDVGVLVAVGVIEGVHVSDAVTDSVAVGV